MCIVRHLQKEEKREFLRTVSNISESEQYWLDQARVLFIDKGNNRYSSTAFRIAEIENFGVLESNDGFIW